MNLDSNLPLVLAMVPAILAMTSTAFTGDQRREWLQMDPKTFFQTASRPDMLIAIGADAVVVHGDPGSKDVFAAMEAWARTGLPAGRMFFADSDAGQHYSEGRWDGKPHGEDREMDASGNVVRCEVRPYMLPTEGWIRYLEEMAEQSVQAGATCIMPEEPLAHVDSGYEEPFKALWGQQYGKAWKAASSSPAAQFLTGQLKSQLYVRLLQRLIAATQRAAGQVGRQVPVILPVHSIYSNVASRLTAPLGGSLNIEGVEGYVGQIWTGPIRWSMDRYRGPWKSFFASALILYDSFNELAAGSDRKLWLLMDPVEDDPNHTWDEFRRWYLHSTAAMLMITDVNRYEIMPWPDRIFLSGYPTGGGSPAPAQFRSTILSVCQALQEMPAGGQWLDVRTRQPIPPGGRVGVAINDSVMWQTDGSAALDGTYGLLMPLVMSGVMASTCVLERSGNPGYLDRFKVLVLSYEALKPLDEQTHQALAGWVRRGGVLVLLGTDGQLDGPEFWWNRQGRSSPLEDLLGELGLEPAGQGDYRVGQGAVLRRQDSPPSFADPQRARQVYLPLIDLALRQAGWSRGLPTAPGFLVRRGPYLIAHAMADQMTIPGPVVDVLDPELPVLDEARLDRGGSGLYRVVEPPADGRMEVLHATHRLTRQAWYDAVLRFEIRGPAGTPAVVRVFSGHECCPDIQAQDAEGKAVRVERRVQGQTIQLRFDNRPAGVRVEVR